MCMTVLARSDQSVEAGHVCIQSRLMAGGLAFLSSMKPGPLSPAVFVYHSFSPAVKIHETVGLQRGALQFLAPSQAVFSHLGLGEAQGDGRHPLYCGESPPSNPPPHALFQQSLAQSSKPRWLC